jgi:hypothetical protein
MRLLRPSLSTNRGPHESIGARAGRSSWRWWLGSCRWRRARLLKSHPSAPLGRAFRRRCAATRATLRVSCCRMRHAATWNPAAASRVFKRLPVGAAGRHGSLRGGLGRNRSGATRHRRVVPRAVQNGLEGHRRRLPAPTEPAVRLRCRGLTHADRFRKYFAVHRD